MELFEQFKIPLRTWLDIFGSGLSTWPIPRIKSAPYVILNPRIIGGDIGDEYLTFTFYEATVAAGTSKGIPKTIVVDRNCTIEKVYVQVETAPGAGKTLTIDVNKNATTIFTTQASRPSITETSTTDESSTPDVTSLTKNDLLSMDVDVHDGIAAVLSVYVRCRKAL